MSSNVRRVLAIVVTVAVMATSVISSMGALAEDVIPTGYNKATGLNVNLAENEYYQPISGFEAMGTDWGVHAYNKGTASESTGIKNSGSKSAKMVHKGFTNEIGSMDFISVINQQNLTIDASKANYLQFYVKNDSVTDIEIAKLCINGPENAQASTITNADVKFFDYSKADKKWEDGKVQTSSTKLDGKKYTAIVVGAGKEGLIRIPMSIWGSPASITRFMFWTSVTLGGAADQTLYIDDLGLVAVVGTIVDSVALNAAVAAADAKVQAEYTAESWSSFTTALTAAKALPATTQAEADAKVAAINEAVAKLAKPAVETPQYVEKPTQNVYINPGEKYKYLFGAEDGDLNTVNVNHPYNSGRLKIISDIKNSGESGVQIQQVTGDSQNGFSMLQISTNENMKDWSDAKYVQFWIKNKPDNAKGILELFFIRAKDAGGAEHDIIANNMQGIKLYNQDTGEWSDLAVTPNSQHRVNNTPNADGTYQMVPSLNIPSGFRGLVRIPLTNDDVKATITDVSKLQMFLATSGSTGNYYIDDLGLVTYDGSTAPAYVNGEATTDPNAGSDNNNNDNNNDNQNNDDVTIDFGNGDYDDYYSDNSPKTGDNQIIAYAIAALVISLGAIAITIKKKKTSM